MNIGMRAEYLGKQSKISINNKECEIGNIYEIEVKSPSTFGDEYLYDISLQQNEELLFVASYKSEAEFLNDWDVI